MICIVVRSDVIEPISMRKLLTKIIFLQTTQKQVWPLRLVSDRSSMTRWTFVSILADRGYYSYGHLVLYTDHEVLKVSGGIFGGILKN